MKGLSRILFVSGLLGFIIGCSGGSNGGGGYGPLDDAQAQKVKALNTDVQDMITAVSENSSLGGQSSLNASSVLHPFAAKLGWLQLPISVDSKSIDAIGNDRSSKLGKMREKMMACELGIDAQPQMPSEAEQWETYLQSPFSISLFNGNSCGSEFSAQFQGSGLIVKQDEVAMTMTGSAHYLAQDNELIQISRIKSVDVSGGFSVLVRDQGSNLSLNLSAVVSHIDYGKVDIAMSIVVTGQSDNIHKKGTIEFRFNDFVAIGTIEQLNDQEATFTINGRSVSAEEFSDFFVLYTDAAI